MREHLPAPEVASPSPARPVPVARTPIRQPVRTPAAGPVRQLARDNGGRGMGNRATIATLAQAGVRVTSPSDQVEREATAVADAVVRAPAPAPVVAVAPAEETVARRPAVQPAATTLATASGVHAAVRPAMAARALREPGRSPRPGFAQTPLARAADDTPTDQVAPAMPKARAVQRNSPAMPRGPPAGLPPVVAAGFSGGSPVAPGVRDRIEPTLGADLSGMRVHSGPTAARAATSVGARAFTIGSDVVLGPGERTDDVALMAHEATHVVQQTPGALAREETEDDSLIPDFILDEVRSVVRSIPGYTLVAAAIGQDPLTGQPVSLELDNAVETLLLAGPFGPGVAVVLKAMDLLSSAWTVVTTTLAAHRITVSRIGEDIDAAWDRFTVANRIDGNVAIVRGYINAFLADIRAAIGDLVGQLIQAVRDAIVPIVEPYLIEGALAPVWNLATKVMHYNPLTGADVTASTAEIIADFLTLIGQDEVLAQMTERGTLQETADWVDGQIAVFLSLIGRAGQLFSDAWDAISPANLPNLLDTLPDLANRAVALFSDVVAFGSNLIAQILVFVRDSLLEWLSEKAHTMRGFKLLTVILGANPFTGAGVERNAENLIGGFIELIAGPETYAQLAESGVIAEAAGKIESEMERLNISWELITGTFTAIWDSLSLSDFLDPIGCIMRVIDQFGEPLSRIISFAATVVQVVLELILRLMNFPSDLLGSIIAGVQQALDNIQADPVGFLNNLLAALKQGFSQFFDNILTHLVQGLADWLFRGLKGLGIEIPTELSGESILKLAMDVMGLSVDFLWECLTEVIGAEKVALIRGAIDKLGQAWAFISDVQQRGMVAVWEYLSTQLGNLWDTILGMAKDWLVSNIIDAAIAKVLSMLDPTGVMAVINSCIAFYRAVQSVIEYVTEILQIVKTYVDTIAAIAAGNIAPGATMLEGGLAAAIPVAIGFLASQVGLGDIPEKIVEIINGLRQAIKDAVIWLIRQALRLGEAALNALGLGKNTPPEEQPTEEEAGEEVDLPTAHDDVPMDGSPHELWFAEAGGQVAVFMASSQSGQILGKIGATLGDPKCPDGIKGELNALQAEVTQLQADIATAWAEPLPSGKTRRRLPKRFVTRLQAARTKLQALGQAHHMSDLSDFGHPSKYVAEGAIADEYRKNWRQLFYGSWSGGANTTCWNTAVTAMKGPWQQANPGTTCPPNFDVYRCAECGQIFSDTGAISSLGGQPVEKRLGTIDHRVPTVGHFQSGDPVAGSPRGLDTIQSVRQGWYNSLANLQPMCKTCNTESLRNDSWDAGPNFRGPGET